MSCVRYGPYSTHTASSTERGGEMCESTEREVKCVSQLKGEVKCVSQLKGGCELCKSSSTNDKLID